MVEKKRRLQLYFILLIKEPKLMGQA